jgi:nitrate reductase gamma subunit
MEFLLGVLFPYTAFCVFVVGTILRIVAWMIPPVPFHLTLFPSPGNVTGRITAIATEFFLCRSLFREDKPLWLMVWLFHLSLVLVIAGHVVGIFFLRNQFTQIGLSQEASHLLSTLLGGIAGFLMALSLGALICRRFFSPLVRELSEPEDYCNLLLLMAIAVTGNIMYIPGFHTDLHAVRSYMGGLLHLQQTPLPNSPSFIIHFSLVNLLLIYFPFSRLLHSMGFFVNRTMLTEAPPIYPTTAGTAPKSAFATKKLQPDIPVFGKEIADREAFHP